MLADLSGQVALITGGSRGVGREIALLFAAHGADVAVNAMNPGPAGEVVAEIERLGRRAAFVRGDVMDYPQVERFTAEAIERLGQVDILVASGGPRGRRGWDARPFHETDPAVYSEFMVSRFLSRLYCVRAVVEHMRQREGGRIILVTTDAGRVPTPGQALGGAAGAGLIQAMKVMAREFARWRIRVNALALTITRDTPGYEDSMARGDFNRALFQKAEQRIPFGPNLPRHVADAALFLASDASSQITGQVLSVNGGLSIP